MNPDLDSHFDSAELWRAEAIALRAVLAGCPVREELKWNQPCYTHGGGNIAIIQRFKGFLALMFFKGALMKDPEGILKSQGKDTRSALRLEFTNVAEIKGLKGTIRDYVAEAIAVEKSGRQVGQAEIPDVPEELIAAMEADPKLQEAFDALTPGRQRGYLLHINAAKQSATRAARIEKARPKILTGKGFNER